MSRSGSFTFALWCLHEIGTSWAFQTLPCHPTAMHRQATTLHGVSEWRDNCFMPDDDDDDDDDNASNQLGELKKPICLLPFDFSETLIQGETKELRLYEDRFLALFEDVHTNHEGMLGMALFSEADGGILGSVPLCEIVDFNNMGGDFGIFLTIQSVGRIELKDVLPDSDLYLRASCIEILDDTCSDLVAATALADQIETTVTSLSDMEIKLGQELEKKEQEGSLPESVTVTNQVDVYQTGDSPDNIDEEGTRFERFMHAYLDAKESDTQGYVSMDDDSSFSDFEGSKRALEIRSLADLTAVSWAAFATESMAELDAAYRIQALACGNLIDRLTQGLLLLEEKKLLVEKLLDDTKDSSEAKKDDDDDDDEHAEDEFQ